VISVLSPKAFAALMAGATGNIRLTASELSKAFPGHGRDYWLGALSELEDLGFLERKKYKAGSNKQWNHYENITELGHLYLKEWLPSSAKPCTENPTFIPLAEVGKPVLLNSENQLIITNNNIATSKEVREENLAKESWTLNMEVDNVPYSFFESSGSGDDYTEEVKQERLKARERKVSEGQTTFSSTRRTRMGSRHDLPQDKWGSNEVAFEFMDRVSNYFNIKHNITIRQITGAFATMRKMQKTTALEELRMMDLFFETTKIDTYDSGEALWKMFIYRASELVVQVRRTMGTQEEKQQASAEAAKSQEWLYE